MLSLSNANVTNFSGTPSPTTPPSGQILGESCFTIRVIDMDDATKQAAIKRLCKQVRPLLCDEWGCQIKPLFMWALLPCMGQHMNILNNGERVEDGHHKLFLKLLRSLNSFLRIMKPLAPELAMELPKPCKYWKWTVVQAFVKKHCLQSCVTVACLALLTATACHFASLGKSCAEYRCQG